MQYLDGPTSRWAQAHFVLTRAGFLHWFRSVEQVEQPIGALSLARCGRGGEVWRRRKGVAAHRSAQPSKVWIRGIGVERGGKWGSLSACPA